MAGASSVNPSNSWHRWSLNLLDDTHVRLQPTTTTTTTTTTQKKEILIKYANPPGYRNERSTATLVEQLLTSKNDNGREGLQHELQRQKRAYKESWNIAMSPLRSLMTMLFAFYMGGNTLGVFTMGSVGTMGFMQVRTLIAVGRVFGGVRREGLKGRLWAQIVVYVAWCLVGLGIVAWKLDRLGLLPRGGGELLLEVRDVVDRNVVVYAPLFKQTGW